MEQPVSSLRNIVSANLIRSPGHALETPLLALSVTRAGSIEGSKDFVEGLLSDSGIDIRVDWDGDGANPGRFEVLVGEEQWQPCPNIEIGEMNDLISPHKIPPDNHLTLRVCRGPDHPELPFQLRLVPITWLIMREPSTTAPPSYTARRGADYQYQDGRSPDDFEWLWSQNEGGMHRVNASLVKGLAYEMHVRLQDPADPERWLQQDPVVRTDHGGSN